jgi:nucleotide-binding universal stress UspA family protein
MYSKILFPTDFGKDSQKAVDFIKKLKDCGTSKVIVLHVVEHKQIDEYMELQEALYDATENKIDVNDAIKKVLEKVYPKLKEIEKEFRDAGIEAEVLVEEGIASKKITEVAEQVGATLIVMGHSKKGFLESAFMGSTARHVIDMAKVPVLIVK